MAGIKITDLPAAPSALLTDVFPVDQLPGPITYKESNSQLLTLFKSNGEALTKTDDTNVTLTLGGSPTTSLLNATSMALGWTGQLSVARGGTGLAALTAHYIPIGNGTSALTLLAPSATSGIPLISQGAASDPTYGTAVVAGGGTGNTTFTAYSVICAGTTATGSFQNVLGLGTAGEQLTSNGPGLLPTWQTGTNVTPSALTRVDDTNVTLTLAGTPATALLQATSITAGWTGTLSGTRGGTGVNNGASTITLGGSLTTSGAFASTFTMTGITGVTFPTSGTLATTAQIPTGAALTKTDDTNVTLTLGGSPTTALVNAASITAGWTGQLGLTRGGTAASLTASTGGIVYSGVSALAILSGTATAGQHLQSGASAAPTWTTATFPSTATGTGTLLRADGTNWAATTSTYPNTNAINTLLYASSANVMSALATANNGILLTSSGGVPSIGNTVGAGLTMPSITFNTTTGVVGTTTNDNAAAGSVGEVISSEILYASRTSLTTATLTNVVSISLTAGDWDVFGMVGVAATGAITNIYCGISSTSVTLPDNAYTNNNATTGSINNSIAPMVRASLSGTTTYYLVVTAGFAGTANKYGYILARRRR